MEWVEVKSENGSRWRVSNRHRLLRPPMTLVFPKHARCQLRHTEKLKLVPADGNDPSTSALSRRRSATELREIKQRGSPTWLRTTVLLVNSQALCQLRYRGSEW